MVEPTPRTVTGQDPDGGIDGEPFSLTMPVNVPIPVLVAVPHAGRVYPAEVLAAMRDPRLVPSRLEDRYADYLGKEIAAATGAALLIAHTPRAMLDLNRAPDDIDWGMVAGSARRAPAHSAANRRARSGLGLVPRRLPGTGEIWRHRLAPEEIETRIQTIHRPYHRVLATTLDTIRDRWGAALLIDLHSMPPLGGGPAAAEFVIGDRFGASCAARLASLSLHQLAEAGRRVAHNRPYSGGYALDHHASPRRGIHAIQIEVCRATYLDGALDAPGPRFAAVSRVLANLVRRLGREVAGMGDPAALRQAAE